MTAACADLMKEWSKTLTRRKSTDKIGEASYTYSKEEEVTLNFPTIGLMAAGRNSGRLRKEAGPSVKDPGRCGHSEIRGPDRHLSWRQYLSERYRGPDC